MRKRGGEREKGEIQREREREKSRTRHGKKSGEGFRLDYRGRILLITGVLWGHETKRFPFNCVPRPVHSAIVLSKNLITGAYGRYPASLPTVPPAIGAAITHGNGYDIKLY